VLKIGHALSTTGTSNYTGNRKANDDVTKIKVRVRVSFGKMSTFVVDLCRPLDRLKPETEKRRNKSSDRKLINFWRHRRRWTY